MILWLILGAMTVLTVAMLLRPLFRGTQATAARDAYDREVYRDQLAEVKREEARGLLAPLEARAAEREIARRLIAAAPAQDERAAAPPPAAGAQPARGRSARRWTALALATALPLAALALYLYVGTPTAPDFPLASREKVMQSEGMHDINEAIPQLEARLKAKPDDLEGWVLLGRSYASVDRMAEAAEAYRHAVALSNNDPDLVAAYAESKVLEGGGAVTPEARKLFEEVRAKDPKNVPARFYLGLVKVQEGDVEAGVREWLVIQAEAPPDAPWLPELHGEIQRVAQEYKLDLAKLVPPGAKVIPPMTAKLDAGAGGTASAGTSSAPSAADVAAAENMSDEQRREMIRSMVERLAARLKGQPDDLAGWQRLARAYGVLGEKDKAADAEAHVAKLEGAAKGAPAQSPPA
ncbi:MAG: c-type cytochrome biogenesis protein CcmI, partial [Alphaproteobacteria bacterium]